MATEEHRPDPRFPFVHGGFQFDNYLRNAALASSLNSQSMPKVLKTGTTIAGCVFDGGVVLGADTRATSSTIVDKNCQKIHYIAPNIYCCGAGTAADTEMTTLQTRSELELLRLNTGKDSRISAAMTRLKRHLFKYQGHVSAALVLGGVDVTGAHLWSVHPHGSCDKLPYMTMGSGSLAAMSVFESEYNDHLSESQAVELVAKAIMAGVLNDLGSGSNVDICVIKAGSVDMKRNYLKPMEVAPFREKIRRPPTFGSFPPGTTVTTGAVMETLLKSVDIVSTEMELAE